MTRVLVYEHLCAGAAEGGGAELLAAGRAMRDAVAGDLLRAGDCAVSVATAPGGTVPRGARAVVCDAPQRALAFVAAEAACHDAVWVVAPETGGVLAALQRAVDRTAARWLGCTAAAIERASSKRATLAHAAAFGISTPLGFDDSGARRWVVKPDDGAGAVATRVHATRAAARADFDARLQRGVPTVLEPWVDGEALSLALLCTAGAAELLAVNRQQIAIDAHGGLSFDGVQIDALGRGDARRAALERWARSIGAAFDGLAGYVGIDLVWHADRGPVLIEINPRVTVAYVGLSAALGRNLASEVLAGHAIVTEEVTDDAA